MKVTFCCTGTPPEPWLQGLRNALPQAAVTSTSFLLSTGETFPSTSARTRMVVQPPLDLPIA